MGLGAGQGETELGRPSRTGANDLPGFLKLVSAHHSPHPKSSLPSDVVNKVLLEHSHVDSFTTPTIIEQFWENACIFLKIFVSSMEPLLTHCRETRRQMSRKQGQGRGL